MKLPLLVCTILVLFAVALHADKFGGPKPAKPAPPADTTQVDSTVADTSGV